MENQIREVIQYSQDLNLDLPHINEWIKDWKKAKEVFLYKMGGNPICELPDEMAFPMTSDIRDQKFDDFITCLSDNICLYDGSLYYFLKEQKDGFFDNKVIKSYCLPDGRIIPEGMKIGKAIRTFFQDRYSIEELDKLISDMSMIIQENAIKGKLCISVHPLDFLSSSENNHSWRSCHALDGDYRAGNISYMLDNCTVIAYLKSNKPDCKLPRFPDSVPWNNKKWRCLLHFDFERGIVWAGRQYPFASDNILDTVKMLLAKYNYFCNHSLISSYNTGKWFDNVKKDSADVNGHTVDLFQPHIFSDGMIMPIGSIVKAEKGSLNYNDILHSSCYNPKYLIFDIRQHNLNFYNTDFNNPLIIGKSCKCPQCGKNTIESSEHFLCTDCRLNETNEDSDEIGYCVQCGRHIIRDPEFSFSDEYYCKDCFNSLFSTCSECGRLLAPDEEETDDDGNILCYHCLRSRNSSNHRQQSFLDWIFD